MALEWEQVVVNAADPVALGRWWAAALEWVVVNDVPEEFEIRPAPDRFTPARPVAVATAAMVSLAFSTPAA